MRVLVGVRVWLRFGTRKLLLLLFLLLGLPSGLLTLFARKFLRFEHALPLSCLLEFSFFFGILLLLFEFLLGRGCSFGAEFLQLLFLLRQLHVRLLLFDHGLHLGLLHTAHVRHHRTVAHCGRHIVLLSNRGASDDAEVGRGVVVIQNVTLDARFLVLPLLASTAHTSLSTWASAWALPPLLLNLEVVVVKADLLVPIVNNLTHGRVLVAVVPAGWDRPAEVARRLTELRVRAHAVL